MTSTRTLDLAKAIPWVNPHTGNILKSLGGRLVDLESNEWFPVVSQIPRFCDFINYAQSFGFQWNKFDKTQLDNFSKTNISESRFYSETAWDPRELDDICVLEVGSGAGRFSEVVLRTTNANLYSIDYSAAVDANWKNNSVYHDRLHLAQASIYQMPFPDNAFDKVFCLGVLQHTPSFEESVRALIRKVKQGGEVVVDFYPINGWYTKLHAKYFFRPITKRLPKETLLRLINTHISWMLWLFDTLVRLNLGVFTRFIPITDVRSFPKTLTTAERLEWAVMDTFDGFSPEFDNPQRIDHVVQMFSSFGCRVTFSGSVNYGFGSASVVRAVKER
jgi:SAM-dependent methyltransferase